MPRQTVVVAHASGLHARPAAALASAAAAFDGVVRVAKGEFEVNGKSLVALLTLDCRHGDEVTLQVEGAGADDALEQLVRLIAVERST
jgi:phosphotransferase system HPr (HPr) family protein